MTPRFLAIATILMMLGAGLAGAPVEAQIYKADVGFDQLLAEVGPGLADGSGLRVGLMEAPLAGNYMPTPANPADYESDFAGKSIANISDLDADVSSHARSVAQLFFGSTTSMSGGISNIDVYEANDFLAGGYLNELSDIEPAATPYHVTNHSYIGNLGETEIGLKIDDLQRFDFVIQRDNTVAVVGTNNSGLTPDLWATSYNAITVGKSSGLHALGLTSDYGTPRFKPDLVAPAGSTSSATAMVSSAAALLIDAGSGTNATRNQAIKAMLFAGATKQESEAAFSNWDRNTTRPIDEQLGFGELNVYNSYQILQGGEFEGSTSEPVSQVDLHGFDFGSFDGTNELYYNFEILADSKLSAALTWNAEITDNDPGAGFAPTVSIANLELELFDSTGSFLGSPVDASLSTDYNLEHLYQQQLAAGVYTFRVRGDAAADFGFAWRISSVPEPGTATWLTLVGAGWLLRRRRSRISPGPVS